jgi:hypothetical protein
MISTYLHLQLGTYTAELTLEHGNRYWQEWVFFESRRRTVNMARIMNIAFTMDHAFSCEAVEGFALIPLPSTKVGWETNDEHVWNAEYDKCHLQRMMYGLSTEGNLVRLSETTKGIERKKEGWKKWLSTQDSFGILVMLASQVLG